MVRLGIAGTPPETDLEVASRTDRGVHARANALSLNSELSGAALLKALNGVNPAIFFSAAQKIDAGFSIRTARFRWYRYFEPRDLCDLERWRAAAALFAGYVDVRSFGREVPGSAPTWRKVDHVGVTPTGRLLRVDLRAPSFVWGMVRKIVAGLRACDRGSVTLGELREAVEGRRRLALPLAEPERLVLWEVGFEGAWEVRTPPQAGHYSWAAAEARRAIAVRQAILRGLWPNAADLPRTVRRTGAHRR